MKARVFQRGQRVQMTEEAERMGLGGRAKRTRGKVRGTVTKADGLSVRVRRDGIKEIGHYFAGFWEPLS